MKPFNLVLFAPEIPQNTGTIGRLCVSTDTKLHLVKPLGFSLDEKHLKRAGMDYWPHLDLAVYFISTKGETSYWDVPYPEGCYMVFGRESSGLPPEFYERYRKRLVLIPMEGKFHRSLNLANAASIVLYEALRQRRCRAAAN